MRSLIAPSFAPLACVVALLAGCAKVQPPPPGYYGPTDPMSKVVQDINANNAKVTTLRAAHSFDATIVDDKGKSHSFSGDGYLLFTKPENLLLTAKKLIPLFEIGANDDRYWFTAFPDEVSTQWWGDKQKLTDLTKRMTKALRKFQHEAPALQEQYRRALPDLISRENWARLYES